VTCDQEWNLCHEGANNGTFNGALNTGVRIVRNVLSDGAGVFVCLPPPSSPPPLLPPLSLSLSLSLSLPPPPHYTVTLPGTALCRLLTCSSVASTSGISVRGSSLAFAVEFNTVRNATGTFSGDPVQVNYTHADHVVLRDN
jgi:hypothetical protein